MYRALSLILAAAMFCFSAGCASSRSLDNFTGNGDGGSGGGGGTGTGFHTGNWAFTGTGGAHGTLNFGGYLNVEGTSVVGTLYVLGTDQASGVSAVDYSNSLGANTAGDFSNGTLNLTTAVSGKYAFNLSLTGIRSNTSTLKGTYSVTSGVDAGDSGTLSGVEVTASETGTWSGSDPMTGGTVTVAMTEATAPTLNAYPLTTSSITFGGVSGCSVTGTEAYFSYAAGNIVYLNLGTIDSGLGQTFVFTGIADSTTAPKTLTGWYIYTGGTSCMFQENVTQLIPFTLTKQ